MSKKDISIIYLSGGNMSKIKYQFLMLFLFIMCITLMPYSIIKQASRELLLFDKVIFIDAGHGGRDPGTIYNNIYEKNINLEISKEVENELGSMGAIVYQTREDDSDLSSIYDSSKKRGDLYRRIQMIEKVNSDLYLSIHIIHYVGSYRSGVQLLYNPINKNNKLLAESIMNVFESDLKHRRDISVTDLYMYKNTKVPGVLIECGFLSNPSERALLQDKEYQKKLAKTIAKGVVDYFKQVQKV